MGKLCDLAKKTEEDARKSRGSDTSSPLLTIRAERLEKLEDDEDWDWVQMALYKSNNTDTTKLDKLFSTLKVNAGKHMRIRYEMGDGGKFIRQRSLFQSGDFDIIVSTFYPNSSMAIAALLTEKTNEDAKERKHYIPGFVETIPKGYVFNCSKSQALLVAGASGAGKTWMTRFGLPHFFGPDVAFLFCQLDDHVAAKMKPFDQEVPSWMSRAMSFLFQMVREAGLPEDSELYQTISKASMHLNSGRNTQVKNHFQEMCQEKILGCNNQGLTDWWQDKGPTLKKLVVVIDECGKSLSFTRGAIDCCRELVGDLCRHGAREAKIVLAGTRLDTWSEDEDSFQTRSEHGTDPSKYEFVQMEKPILSKLQGLKISAGDLKGWYSQILAENTRILMRAVIPTLTIPALTEHYYDIDISVQVLN